MKVGDKMFGFRFDSIGINAVWLEEMSKLIGKIGVVYKIQDGEVCLEFEGDGYIIYLWYPIPTDPTYELLAMLKRVHNELDCAEFCSYVGIPSLVDEIEVLIKKVEDGN